MLNLASGRAAGRARVALDRLALAVMRELSGRVSRALGIFERDGLVRVGRQRIEACDLDGLDAIADDH